MKNALLDGFTIGLVDHVRAWINEGHKGIPHLLSAHATEKRTGEVINIAGRVLLPGCLCLIGLRVVEHAKYRFHVILGSNNQFLDVLLHLWDHRDSGVHEFVQWLDQSQAKGTLPESISDDGGEARVFWAGHPACIGLQGRLSGLSHALMSHHGAGLHG